MKIGCGRDSTTLTIWDPVAGALPQGMLYAGDFWPYYTPITSGLVLSGMARSCP